MEVLHVSGDNCTTPLLREASITNTKAALKGPNAPSKGVQQQHAALKAIAPHSLLTLMLPRYLFIQLPRFIQSAPCEQACQRTHPTRLRSASHAARSFLAGPKPVIAPVHEINNFSLNCLSYFVHELSAPLFLCLLFIAAEFETCRL